MKNIPFASIEKIILITPITSGSNAFEKATLSNYHQVVFEKGLFKLDDLCVFLKENTEISKSLLERLELDNLLSNVKALTKQLKKVNFIYFIVKRKTIEGQVSEGVCLPLSILPKGTQIQIGQAISGLPVFPVEIENHKKNFIERKKTLKTSTERKVIAKGLLTKIKVAFSNVALGDGISLRQSRLRCIDYDDCPDVSLDERENWQKITDEDLIEYYSTLHCCSDEKGRAFYSPAYMCLGLNKFIKTGEIPSFGLNSDIIPTLTFNNYLDSYCYLEKIFSFDEEQTLLIKHYIAFFSEDIKYCSIRKAKEFISDLQQYLTGVPLAEKKPKFVNKPNAGRHRKKRLFIR